jgi:hypothetical protein
MLVGIPAWAGEIVEISSETEYCWSLVLSIRLSSVSFCSNLLKKKINIIKWACMREQRLYDSSKLIGLTFIEETDVNKMIK